MTSFIREITTQQGDVLRVGLSFERRLLSSEALELIGETELMGVELLRIAGNKTIGHDALQAIEEFIAGVFDRNDNLMIFYFCDFINPIPKTSKNKMSPQEYRSRLFEKMFERYVHLHNMNDVHLSVITVDGIDETYYFHLIYRGIHEKFASIINSDIKEGYSK